VVITPKVELSRRTGALQERLVASGIDGALIVDNVNLFYFSGTVQQAFLFVPAEGETLLFVRKNPDRVKNESFLDQIIPVKGIRQLRERLSDFGYRRIARLGLELDVLPVNHYFRYLRELTPGEIVDVWPAVQTVRTVKSEYEIGLMRKAAVLADHIVEAARCFLREGISEIELVAEVEKAARSRGHQGLVRMRGFNREVYWGHLVSGPDAADPSFIDFATGGRGLTTAFPSGSGWRMIQQHDPVMVDLAAGLNGYIADESRTLCLGGLSERLDHAYRVAREIEGVLEAMIRPGIEAGAIFAEAERIATAHGLEGHFMGYGSQKAGFVGHGIGLELNELPVFMPANTMVLEKRMVCALEPKFTFPDEGVVGVEDVFVVTEEGSEKLTSASYDPMVKGL